MNIIIKIKTCLCGLLMLCLFLVTLSVTVYATDNEEEDISFNSVVEIQDYQIDEGYIKAGENANISLTIHNANRLSTVNSLVIMFSSYSGKVYPAYGNDNQLFIGTLKAGESKTVSLPITVDSGFDSDFADFCCDLIYESEGRKIKNTVSMILPSENTNEVVVRSVEVSAHAIKDGKSLLSIIYSNNSSNNINDAEIIIKGNVSESTKNIKLDPLVAGKTYTKDYNIVFTQIGEQTVSFMFRYINSDGEQKELELGTYNVNVEEESSSEALVESENPVLLWSGRVIALVAVIILIIVLLKYILKR